MRLLLNENIFGWKMTGFLGKNGRWFLGYSKEPKKLSPHANEEKKIQDKSYNCTIILEKGECMDLSSFAMINLVLLVFFI